VVVTAGQSRQAQAVLSQTSYYSHDDLRLHFGLGAYPKAERIEIFWPGGEVDVLKETAANQLITIREGVGIIKASAGAR
jgi:hypothetical protein